jgi:HSP20 family protein
MDVYRQGDHFVLLADLPGVDPGSVHIDVDNGTLTIKAERSDSAAADVQWLSSERFPGTYMRQLALGEGIDAEKIPASDENGVLTVLMPVAEKAKARRIEVSAPGSQVVIEAGH